MSEKRSKYLRFAIPERTEHWLFVITFATLAMTGLVQMFASLGIAQGIIVLLGGIETVRVIHRVAATMMMFETIYHIGIVGYKVYVRRSPMNMLPGLNDIRVAWKALLHNLGFVKEKVQQGRYTFEEKAEYWAVVWGTVVMAITGFAMWNPIATTRYLPGQLIPAAKAAHSAEAVLAVLAIIVWHFYHVHLRRFNTSMIGGHLDEQEMLEEHPLELADIKAGAKKRIPPEILRKRRRIYFPIYAVIATVLLAGVYTFVTIEETSITTLPPAERVSIYAPLTPTPLPTALPTTPPQEIGATWNAGIGALFQEKCGLCHSDPSGLGNLDLSDYQPALTGGASGLLLIPGDSANSLLIIRQTTGDHPGQLSIEEIARVRDWIDVGAPQ
ncbi:MAG: cytochrome b/b6 domain-containing protein [Anaerolineales bacterium]|nr:cytochrome b/b6 domain-containing protein [Anaerolineales bacterium]